MEIERQETKVCPFCGKETNLWDKFCNYCDEYLGPYPKRKNRKKKQKDENSNKKG